MRTKNLFYALALGAAFTACSQEEIVNGSTLNNGESFKNYAGEVYTGGINFTKDGDVESRMAVNNGTPSWINGDKVGLVWTNAIEGKKEDKWQNAPEGNLIYSNTRMTYDANAGNWYMTDGQIFKGMYLAYYPFNEDIQSVQQFAVSQNNEQKQTNSTTETLNEVAEKLVWISQRYESDEDLTTSASLVYPFIKDDVESGTGSEINVRMKPFSNILDARFYITKKDAPAIDLNPEVVVVKALKLVAVAEEGNVPTVWPTTGSFNFNTWGFDFDVKSQGLSGLDGRKLFIDAEGEGFVGSDFKNAIQVTFANEAANAGAQQRANFMFLPWNAEEGLTFAIKVETDYGYVLIPETAWKKAATNNGGLIVNPTAVEDLAPVQAHNALNTLTNRIGMQAVRFFNVYAQDLQYNNITVSKTEELVEAIRKWNVLGKEGVFTVNVAAENNFANLVWSEAATVAVEGETWNTPEAIQEFLANPKNVLNVTATTPVVLNNAAIDDENTLVLDNVTVKSVGKLQVTVEQVIEVLNTEEGSALIIPTEGKVSLEYASIFKGATNVAQLAELEIQNGASITNEGEFTLNGTLNIPAAGASTIFTNDGTFNLLKHGDIAGTTSGAHFYNNDSFYYVENGTKTNVTYHENGKTIAEINDANKATALSNYIKAASDFGCTTLNIETSSNLEAEWDNTASTLNFAEINLADGVTLKLAKDFTAANATMTISGNVTIETVNTVATTQLNIAGLVLEAGATLNVADTKLDVNVTGNITMKGAAGQTTTLNGVAQTNKTAAQIVKPTAGTYAIQ